MKTQLSTILFLLLSNCLFGQKVKDQIEINPYVRMDWYPKFSYSINPVNTNDVNIKGKSWGVNANYKLHVHKHLSLKAGIGYYRYSFDKIDSYNTLFGKGTSRVISFPSPLYIIFTTDKYGYNTISANIGIEKFFDLKNDFQIVTGLNLNNYYTFSQSYHITYDNPITNPYKLKNNRFFGLSANIQLGLLKKFNHIGIGPTIVLPVYDVWKQDKIFPQNETSSESNSSERHKWFGGIGLGISCNYSLNKK